MTSPTTISTVVEFDPEWQAVGSIYGGHVVSRLVEAANALEGFTPVAATAHFFGSVRSGAAGVTARPVHVGAMTATVSVELAQGHPKATVLVKLARTDKNEATHGLTHDLTGFPEPSSLPAAQLAYGHLPYERFIDLRLIEGSAPLESRGWIRLREPAGVAAAVEACELLDALPPGPFELLPTPSVVPTVEFTAHFVPGFTIAGEWHFVHQRLVWSGADSCIEESDLFASDGRLVARARQARRIVR